jgi:hypothetical protein
MERPYGATDSWPLGEADAITLVARVAREIDDRSSECNDVLLSDLVCAAWPSRPSQDQ